MNPEHAAMRSLDNRKRVDDIKSSADTLLLRHEAISNVMGKIALNPEDFRDLYHEGVDRDLRYVQKRKESFAQNKDRFITDGLTEGDVRKLAEVVEYEVMRGINLGNWIPFCRAIKTSEYDDIAKGIDFVLELVNKELYGHLGLGVDVTFAEHAPGKFLRIKDEIDKFDGEENRLGTVKYYNSKNTGIRGELSNMPRVVFALDLPALQDLTHIKNENLNGHILQHGILMEVEHQLAVFADYAQRVNRLALPHIQKAQNFIHRIILSLESERKLQTSEYGKNRKAEKTIEEGLALFRK